MIRHQEIVSDEPAIDLGKSGPDFGKTVEDVLLIEDGFPLMRHHRDNNQWLIYKWLDVREPIGSGHAKKWSRVKFFGKRES